MMNNVRGRTLFVDAAFPKQRSSSTPPVLEYVVDAEKRDRPSQPPLPSHSAMRQLAASAFYTRQLAGVTSQLHDVLQKHIDLMEGGGIQAISEKAAMAILEEIYALYTLEDRHHYLLSPVALSCVKQVEHAFDRVVDNIVRSSELGHQGQFEEVINSQKYQLEILRSLKSVLTLNGELKQGTMARSKPMTQEVHQEVHQEVQKKVQKKVQQASTEASSQSTPEMDSKEVQVVSKVQDAQVQTKNTTKGVDAMTQSVVKSQSRSMQSKPSVRALHTQTIRDLLVDRSTQYEAKQNEAVTQTSLIASALTMDEWQNLEQVLSSMQVDLGEKISSYHSRKSSKNFNIEQAQSFVAPYVKAFEQIEQYIKGQTSTTEEVRVNQQQMMTRFCDCLSLVGQYRAMSYVAMYPIKVGDRHDGLKVLAKELENLRYQHAAKILKALQAQDPKIGADEYVEKLKAMQVETLPWSLQNKNQLRQILDQLLEDVEDYILGLDGKLSNYACTHTEESIVGVLVNAFLPLVVQVADAAESAASDSSKQSDLDQYSQFMNYCEVHLSGKIASLMSKLAGENKERDQKMLNILISMMQAVATQNKEKEVNELPQVSAAKELPVASNEKKEITHWPEYLAKMAGVTKWKELDLTLIGNLTKQVAHDIYQVDFYKRQELKDAMWPEFRNVLQLEVNIKESLKQAKERKKKNNGLEKAHKITLDLFALAFEIAKDVYKERAQEIKDMRKI